LGVDVWHGGMAYLNRYHGGAANTEVPYLSRSARS
jgi:hypothetical protein